MDILGIFVERLIELRKDEGMSQGQLARAIGITQAAVSLWEKGQRTPNIEMLRKLADVFGVSADYLIGRSNDY